jgi:hypothetical protein
VVWQDQLLKCYKAINSNYEAIKQILKLNPTTGGATQAIEFVVDRYKLPESVAARLVANERCKLPIHG